MSQKQLPESLVTETEYHVATRGYSVIEGFLTGAECRLLKEAYEPLLFSYKASQTERSVADRHHIHDLLARDIVFGELLDDIRLQQLVSPLLGAAWIMYAFTSSSVPPKGENFGRRIHVDSPRLIPGYVTNVGIIWALDEFTKDNGGTEVLPGSQHCNSVPAAEVFDHNCAQLECAAGAVIIFNARLFHRAGTNHTARWRHSLTMNCCRPYMKQRMDWVRLIPESISSRLGDQARRLVGFHTRLPTSLAEFDVPEHQRLYRSGQE